MKNAVMGIACTVAIAWSGAGNADTVSAFLYESGDDVIYEYMGSIDITGFVSNVSTPGVGSLNVLPNAGLIEISVSGRLRYFDIDVSGAPFGTGDVSGVQNNTVIGDSFSFELDFDTIGLPDGYISQTPLAGSATMPNRTLAGIGADIGVYTYETTFNGNVTNTITLTVGSAPPAAPVPVPAGLPMLAAGLGAVVYVKRRVQA
ncbi:MAG: VPLPA-CTERM sorting domain-containing protein [Pseudomonadota bacterium]